MEFIELRALSQYLKNLPQKEELSLGLKSVTASLTVLKRLGSLVTAAFSSDPSVAVPSTGVVLPSLSLSLNFAYQDTVVYKMSMVKWIVTTITTVLML